MEPTSAPPLFTPPEIPDYLLTDGQSEDGTNAENSSLGEICMIDPALHETLEPNDITLRNVSGRNGGEKFSFEMSDNQQKQYNTQFSSQTSVDSSSNKRKNDIPTSLVLLHPMNLNIDVGICIYCHI